jgi:hypothetical protein
MAVLILDVTGTIPVDICTTAILLPGLIESEAGFAPDQDCTF